MSALGPFVDELAHVGDVLAARSVQRRRRRRVAALMIGGMLAVGGAAGAAGPIWRPLLGDERCGTPVTTFASPPADQLRHLAVLRRPQTTSDRGAASQYALSQLSPRSTNGVRLEFVRTARIPDSGEDVVLIPALSASGKRDALCLFVKDDPDGGAIGCFTTAELLAGGAVVQISVSTPVRMPNRKLERVTGSHPPPDADAIRLPNPSSAWMSYYGIAPDGIVRVELGDTSAPVHDNVYRLRIAESASVGPEQIRWIDEDGQVVVGPHLP